MPVTSVNTSRSAHSDGGYRTPCEPGRHLGNHAAIGAGQTRVRPETDRSACPSSRLPLTVAIARCISLREQMAHTCRPAMHSPGGWPNSEHPALAAAAGHVRSFAAMMTRRQGLLALEDWLTAIEASDQPALHSFARGIRRDQHAVTAGLALTHNSGALEGKNCKIKYLKRLMYGRANFDLLRKIVLLN